VDKELIIKSGSEGVEVALLEDKNLVEFHRESTDNECKVGDIYLGSIKKINPGLNAAFLDVGHAKDAFLHYTDLGPQIRTLSKYTNFAINGNRQQLNLENFRFEPEIVKTGKINNALSKKHPLLVQILKEPISTKGPRLTCEITLAGRYLVLTPFNDTIGVSKKIESSEERKRLHRLIESIKPKNFGVVIRTVAQNKGVAELHDDLTSLLDKWTLIVKRLSGKKPTVKILSEIDKTSGLIRDLLNESFSKIVTNDKVLAADLKKAVAGMFPGKEKIISSYQGKAPLFDHYGITKQIKSLFGKSVTMGSGAYLVIEHTEALHVIDVNSGYKVSTNTDHETNVLNVNVESAKEIARQLRLRDIGGIIIVDFIDMKQPANKKALFQVMKDAMKNDSARHTILPVSRFGLIQITRQRVRPEISIETTETCPTCNGSGTIGPSVLIIDEIQRTLDQLLKLQNFKSLKLIVHPFIEAYLKKDLYAFQRKWFKKHSKWVRIESNIDYQMIEFHFFDQNSEEISIDKK
jgi:ribonuclease G